MLEIFIKCEISQWKSFRSKGKSQSHSQYFYEHSLKSNDDLRMHDEPLF